jgi:uncharacterized RDD family membrane protein YckC
MDHNPYAAPSASLDPVVGSASVPVRVGFGPRLGASLLDFVVIGALGFALMDTVARLFPDYLATLAAQSQPKGPAAAQLPPAFTSMMQTIQRWSLAVGFVGIFYALIEGFTGRALGKLLLGLRIADDGGRAASIPRLLGRMAFKQSAAPFALLAMVTGIYTFSQISMIPSLIVFIGCLVVLGKRRQAFHDMVAKTAVYRNSDVILPGR